MKLTPPKVEALVTINQYSILKGITRRTINRQINSGKLKAYRDPKDVRWLILVDLTNKPE